MCGGGSVDEYEGVFSIKKKINKVSYFAKRKLPPPPTLSAPVGGSCVALGGMERSLCHRKC